VIDGVPLRVSVLPVTRYPSVEKVSPPAVIASPSVTVPAVPWKIAESGVALLQMASSYGPPSTVPQFWDVVSQAPVPDQYNCARTGVPTAKKKMRNRSEPLNFEKRENERCMVYRGFVCVK